MKHKGIFALTACSITEEDQLKKLFGLRPGKGGAGGDALSWSEDLDAVIIYPGEDGKITGEGRLGASPSKNLAIGAVIKVVGTEQGLELMMPGFRGVLPWSVIDDLERQNRV